ncbi:MAG: 2-hydroxyhepta-2,4-diene-1,7-dioate isomerase [Candidatus Bathyarchaeota archaeon B26-2]|nr:MAG: 2-hydroxyhepta-2,4-diene-1,7-dioate isomerase [Candidatus Bathyarchaeota archaeon B26-2]
MVVWALRLVTFRVRGRERVGAYHDGVVVDLRAAYAALLGESMSRTKAMRRAARLIPGDMVRFLSLGDMSLEAAESALEYVGSKRIEGLTYDLNEVTLRAPVPRPGKIFALAGNYAEHFKEVGMVLPKKSRPRCFVKVSSIVIGPGEPILLPRGMPPHGKNVHVDWEAELAVVMGRRGKYIPKERAYEYVAGYTIMNDVSARRTGWTRSYEVPDIERDKFFDWLIGKNLDTFAPMGPWLVTKDEISDPQNLNFTLKVNGVTRQDSNTRWMIYKIPEIIEYLSTITTLYPGDVIATGTCSGIGWRPPDGKAGTYLKDGDVVEIEFEGIGILRNPVKEEPPIEA